MEEEFDISNFFNKEQYDNEAVMKFFMKEKLSEELKANLIQFRNDEQIYFFVPKIGSKNSMNDVNELKSYLDKNKIVYTFKQHLMKLKDGEYTSIFIAKN